MSGGKLMEDIFVMVTKEKQPKIKEEARKKAKERAEELRKIKEEAADRRLRETDPELWEARQRKRNKIKVVAKPKRLKETESAAVHDPAPAAEPDSVTEQGKEAPAAPAAVKVKFELGGEDLDIFRELAPAAPAAAEAPAPKRGRWLFH